MARGRMLNKSVCASRKFHNLPDDTCRLMATWIISQLDLRGVFYADPGMVRSLVFPRRTDISIDHVQSYLEAMVEVGLIKIFYQDGEPFQFWPGFQDNQVGLRAEREASGFPLPPAVDVETTPEECRNDDGDMPEECRSEAEDFPAEVKLREIKFKRNKQRMDAEISPKPDASPDAGKPEPPTASPPEATKRAKRPEPKPPPPPAVQAYREVTGRWPPKSYYGDIDRDVGNEPGDLEFWREVVKQYGGCGWNQFNVKTMLEFYRRREIPSTKKPTGARNATHSGNNGVAWASTDGYSADDIERIISERERVAPV